jgi:hypothetical protein
LSRVASFATRTENESDFEVGNFVRTTITNDQRVRGRQSFVQITKLTQVRKIVAEKTHFKSTPYVPNIVDLTHIKPTSGWLSIALKILWFCIITLITLRN